jgi:hypothetical protein
VTVTNGYCTVQELRDQFGDSGSTLPLSLLERAINATSRAIDDYCDRRFWQDPTPVARTYSPDASTWAFVDDISTTTGLIVQVDDGLNGGFATTWTQGTDFVLRPSNAAADGKPWYKIVAVGGRPFPCSATRDTLQVTARFGWTAIPDGVNQACVLRAAALFQRREATFGVAGFGEFGVVRITRRDADVIDLLAPFVRNDVLVA